ncbi:hypothetical protein GCM10028801_41390 [Nocardioides maradonensis]
MPTSPGLKQTDLITVTRLGHTFRASRRTVAWLDWIIADFARIFPRARLVMLQPCYDTGVAASAGTHDKDAVFDFGFIGTLGRPTLTWRWLRFQRFFRNHCAAAWWRHTGTWASPSAYHVHGFPLPADLKHFTTEVGIYVDGGASQGHPGSTSSQLVDYMNAAEGLAGQHAARMDRTYRPRRIAAFDYDRWVAKHGIPTR